MCIVIVGFLLLLLYYSDSLLNGLQLSETVANANIVIAEGWGILQALWPLAMFLLLLGVLVTLLAWRFSSMLREKRLGKETDNRAEKG